MTSGADGPSSTLRRMVLGRDLRRLREQNQVTRKQAAHAIKSSESKISRLELGKAPFKTLDVTALLDLYGVPEGPARVQLLSTARYANAPSWWQSYSDVLPGWFHTYVDLEASALQIRTFESQFIPGLLQTEAYSRAITRSGRSRQTARQADRRVKSRRERQRILARSGAILWAVIDEGALRRSIGGREVMREQLEQLLHLIDERANITIQVLPFAIGSHPAEVGAFSMLRFAEQHLPEIVYLEHLSGALYLDKVEEVEPYQDVFEQLAVIAIKPPESADLIAGIIKAF